MIDPIVLIIGLGLLLAVLFARPPRESEAVVIYVERPERAPAGGGCLPLVVALVVALIAVVVLA